MKLIAQKVENISQTDFSYEGIMKFVERVGRICYNSTDKITEDSWKDFINMLIKNKHLSPFGHATIHIKTAVYDVYQLLINEWYSTNGSGLRMENYDGGRFGFSYWAISMRVFIEKFNKEQRKRIMQYIDETPSEIYTKRNSFLCTTSISVARELNRHGWNLDIMEKSTRYTECFDIIEPYWFYKADKETKEDYKKTCKESFDSYKRSLGKLKKQEARGVLPLDTATQVIYTAFDHQWQDVFNKRLVSGAHPDCKRLVKLIKEGK